MGSITLWFILGAFLELSMLHFVLHINIIPPQKVTIQKNLLVIMSEEFSGFPTLKPAIISKLHIGDVHPLGQIPP